MYDDLLNSEAYDFNINIIEKQKEYIGKLLQKINQSDLNEITQPDINELPKKKLFIGDSVYVRTYSDEDENIEKKPFDDLQKSLDAGVIKKISTEDNLPVTPTPTPTQTISPNNDDGIINYIDKYISNMEKNKITSWHIFFILFFIYILARVFRIDFKFNVDI